MRWLIGVCSMLCYAECMIRVVDNYEKKLNSINDKLTPIRGKVKRYRCVEEYVTIEEWEEELARSRAREKSLNSDEPNVYYTTTLPPLHDIRTTEYPINPTEKLRVADSTSREDEEVKHSSSSEIIETTTQNWEEMDDAEVDKLIEEMYLKRKEQQPMNKYAVDKDGNYHIIDRVDGVEQLMENEQEIRRKPIHRIAHMIDSSQEMPDIDYQTTRTNYRKPLPRFHRLRRGRKRMRSKVKPFKRLIYRPKNIVKQLSAENYEPPEPQARTEMPIRADRPPYKTLRPIKITMHHDTASNLPPQMLTSYTNSPSALPAPGQLSPAQIPPPALPAIPAPIPPTNSLNHLPYFQQSQPTYIYPPHPNYGPPQQQFGPPPANAIVYEKATKENCVKMQRLASDFGIKDILKFAKDNCLMLLGYVPYASCDQIYHFVASCKENKFLMAM